MAMKKKVCTSHPDRAAIGVCIITSQPICAECSTRYEGVNYSKEGLRILQQRRAAESGRAPRRSWLTIAAWVSSPVLLYLVYLYFLVMLQHLIDLGQLEF